MRAVRGSAVKPVRFMMVSSLWLQLWSVLYIAVVPLVESFDGINSPQTVQMTTKMNMIQPMVSIASWMVMAGSAQALTSPVSS